MSRTKLGVLAVSMLALGAAFTGYNQASAFSPNSPIILAQAGPGGPGGGPGGGAGGPGGPGGSESTGQSPGGAVDGPLAPRGTPPAAESSPSVGSPEECAKMTDPIQRSACMDRLSRGTPPVRQ